MTGYGRGRLVAAAIGATMMALAGCADVATDGTTRPAGGTGPTAIAAEIAAEAAESEERYLPRFTEDGRLLRPRGWEAWVLAGTSMGLTYAENSRQVAPGDAPGSFLQVYVQPWAYETFMKEGGFPENTMFILAGSRPVSKADPARGGFYQGDLFLMEVHLKRDGIDPSGWAFFGYGGDTEAAERIPSDASCYSCHAEHADHDNVFVQFYPKMRERLGMAPPEEQGVEPTPPAEGGAGEAASAAGEGE